jgi:hypothetical protein
MFSRIATKVRRQSSLPTKISFQVDVQRVVFTACKEVPEGSSLSVCFERGEHNEATGEYPVQALRDGTFGTVIGETLTIDCTMYKDAAGKYQEKKGRLLLRQLVKDRAGAETYKTLGTVQLDLDSLGAHPHQKQEVSFTLKESKVTNGRIMVVISTMASEVRLREVNYTDSDVFMIFMMIFRRVNILSLLMLIYIIVCGGATYECIAGL